MQYFSQQDLKQKFYPVNKLTYNTHSKLIEKHSGRQGEGCEAARDRQAPDEPLESYLINHEYNWNDPDVAIEDSLMRAYGLTYMRIDQFHLRQSSIQVRDSIIFQVSENSHCRLLVPLKGAADKNGKGFTHKVKNVANIVPMRYSSSLTTLKQRYVVVTGGIKKHGFHATKLVHRFCIDTLKWFKMPDMLTGKYQHASCAFGETVYVFCGSQPVNAGIERLDDACSDDPQQWRRVPVKPSNFLPRMLCLAVPVNA